MVRLCNLYKPRMHKVIMEPRFFSVEEANRELPKIKKKLDKIFYMNNCIKDVSKDVQELINIWGNDIFDARHIDNKFYMEMIEKRAKLIDDIQLAIENINAVGCVVKDVDLGLVDFFHKKGSEIVFLCWRYGEERISHWHHMNAGFANRRPIEELAPAI